MNDTTQINKDRFTQTRSTADRFTQARSTAERICEHEVGSLVQTGPWTLQSASVLSDEVATRALAALRSAGLYYVEARLIDVGTVLWFDLDPDRPERERLASGLASRAEHNARAEAGPDEIVDAAAESDAAKVYDRAMSLSIAELRLEYMEAVLPHRIDAVVGGSSDDPFGTVGATRHRLTLLAWPGRGEGEWTWYRDTAEECTALVEAWREAAAQNRLDECPGYVVAPDGPRVRSLRLHAIRRMDALAALTAALQPYGSIAVEVPALMIKWVSGDGDSVVASLAVAHQLLDAIQGADGDCSDLTIGDFRAAVRTPTSGTLISLQYDTGGWTIAVDFGERGSHRRADALCDGPHPWQVTLVDGVQIQAG